MDQSNATVTPNVVSEILNGQGMTLADAARLCPASRGKGKVSPTTLLRWITVGAQRYDGTLVRLEAVRFGRRWMVSGGSTGSVARFLLALTPTEQPPPPPHSDPACPEQPRPLTNLDP